MVTSKRNHSSNNGTATLNGNNIKHKLYPSPSSSPVALAAVAAAALKLKSLPNHKMLGSRSRASIRAISTSSASDGNTDTDAEMHNGDPQLISIPKNVAGALLDSKKMKPLKIRLSIPSSKNSNQSSPVVVAAIANMQQYKNHHQNQQNQQTFKQKTSLQNEPQRPIASGSNVVLTSHDVVNLSSSSENENVPLSASSKNYQHQSYQGSSSTVKISPRKNRDKTHNGSSKTLAALYPSLLLSTQTTRRPKLRSSAASAQSARPPIENPLRPDDSISHQGISSESTDNEAVNGDFEDSDGFLEEGEEYDEDDDDMMTSEQEQSHRNRKVRRRQRKERAWRYSLFHDADSFDTNGLEYGDEIDYSGSSEEDNDIMDIIFADSSSDESSDTYLQTSIARSKLDVSIIPNISTPSAEEIVAADLKGDIEDIDASELLFGGNWDGNISHEGNLDVEFEFHFGNDSSEDLDAPDCRKTKQQSSLSENESDGPDADDSSAQDWHSSDGQTTDEDISFWTSASELRKNPKSPEGLQADPLIALTRAASDWGVSVQAAATMLSNVTSPVESNFNSGSPSDSNLAGTFDTPRANIVSSRKKPIMGLFAPAKIEQACAFIDGSPAPIESPFRRIQSSGKAKRKRMTFSLESVFNQRDDTIFMSPLSSALPSPSLPSEPLNMQDLLDVDMLQASDANDSDANSDDERFDDTAALRQIAGLNRWGKVPIGQFRRSRTSSRLSPTVSMSSPTARHMVRDPHARLQITTPSEQPDFSPAKATVRQDKKKVKKERIEERDSKIFLSDLITA